MDCLGFRFALRNVSWPSIVSPKKIFWPNNIKVQIYSDGPKKHIFLMKRRNREEEGIGEN